MSKELPVARGLDSIFKKFPENTFTAEVLIL
jgi:hypothetical protein